MEQLSFLALVTVKEKVVAKRRPKTVPPPNNKWQLLAERLKRERMGIIDREEFLIKQIERMKHE